MAASAGNHGLGVAYAASKLGARVTVVVPEGASAAKVAALQQFDVRLVLHGEEYGEAEAHALALAAEEGGRYVSPYNDADVIAGQATFARELRRQVPSLGTVVVPVRRGRAAGRDGPGASKAPVSRVIGIESEASPSMCTALAAGRVMPIEVEPSVADGLAGNLEPGTVTLRVALGPRGGGPHRQRGGHPLGRWPARRRSRAWCSRVPAPSAWPRCATGVVAPDAGAGQTVVLLTGRNVAPKLLSEVLHS